MGPGIFKAIFGHFLNTYGTQMKIWTSKNILNTNIAQMNSKFNKIILFQNFEISCFYMVRVPNMSLGL